MKMDKNKYNTTLMLDFQQAEVDGAALYRRIATLVKKENERRILLSIADDEMRHAKIMQRYTNTELKPNLRKVLFFYLITLLMGYTFSIKLMERDEVDIKERYREIIANGATPEETAAIVGIVADEEKHETTLLSMLEEERVRYIGSTVLGMNDALVELTGALAGYTLAMQNTRLISMAGIITGFSATLSMAASGYLSARADGKHNALKSSVYTGIAYFITVLLLILPYLTLPEGSYMTALFCTVGVAVGIIAFFNWYTSVVLDRSFKQGFLEMAGLSIGVAILSFVIGIVVKQTLGIDL